MITVEHLTKCYGDFLAVDDLSFEIEEGHVYGFLGPNGAGKSTTMNIITGCLSATAGSVRIDGYDIFTQPNQAKRLIGYLPEQPPLYMSQTPAEYLRFVGEAKGLSREDLEVQIPLVMEQTGITQGQRVGIAQALLGNPKAIILDEPTVGLDPLQIIEIRDLIRQLGRDHTVILSSHILSEVQAICDRVLIIVKGKLVALDATENLETAMASVREVSFTAEATRQETKKLLAGLEGVKEMTLTEGEKGRTIGSLRLNQGDAYDVTRRVFRAFSAAGKVLLELTVKKTDLEGIFIELAGAEEQEDKK